MTVGLLGWLAGGLTALLLSVRELRKLRQQAPALRQELDTGEIKASIHNMTTLGQPPSGPCD